jgi:hypothetical protein
METPPQSNAKAQSPTAQDLAEPNQAESLTKELILYLSKEIETTMTVMMAFRTRVGFGMFIGPFLLLGSFIVGAKGQPVSFNLTWSGGVALLVDAVCFLGIAYIAARIEAQALKQCNKWRELIWELRKDPSFQPKEKEWKLPVQARAGYLAGYFLLFISVVAAVFIIKNAGTVEAPKSVETGATFRIEQVSPGQH